MQLPYEHLGKSCMLVVLVLLFQLLLMPQETVAFSPLDSATIDGMINTTLSSFDLASSQTSFIRTEAPVIKLKWLWVNCGIDNRGPAASIRVYLDLASDSVEVYFEFVSVYKGWRGVARGSVNYEAFLGLWASSATLDPPGASGTGVSVHLGNNLVNSAGGGFISVARVWAEGSQISVYAGECQYGIGFESAPTGGVSTWIPFDTSSIALIATSVLVVSTGLVYSRKKRKKKSRSNTRGIAIATD